jgi:hypothetical protein
MGPQIFSITGGRGLRRFPKLLPGAEGSAWVGYGARRVRCLMESLPVRAYPPYIDF